MTKARRCAMEIRTPLAVLSLTNVPEVERHRAETALRRAVDKYPVRLLCSASVFHELGAVKGEILRERVAAWRRVPWATGPMT